MSPINVDDVTQAWLGTSDLSDRAKVLALVQKGVNEDAAAFNNKVQRILNRTRDKSGDNWERLHIFADIGAVAFDASKKFLLDFMNDPDVKSLTME